MAAKTVACVVGGGIGGCTAALALHKAGAKVVVYEQASQLLEIGAGINVQAVAIACLSDLGVSVDALGDPAHGDGIKTGMIKYYSPEGVFIADEMAMQSGTPPRPQFSLHRAKFHSTLIAECRRVLGEENVHLDASFSRLENTESGVIAHFNNRAGEAHPPVRCDLLVGADGLKSRVRASLVGDKPPTYTGRTIYRGICELDELIDAGTTVSLCGNFDKPGNFICYPVSEAKRLEGKTLCNWGFVAHRTDPIATGESWTQKSTVEDIREELTMFDGNKFGGLTPLQIAEKTDNIIGWALFDRDPIDTFDFGAVTMIGDAAHPLLPFGSQGATQAILDGEALGIALQQAVAAGEGVKDAVRRYSDMRCEITGKIVISNRGMGPTAVLDVVDKKCAGFDMAAKRKWIEENGREQLTEVIQKYRSSMPKSARATLATSPP